VRKDVASSPKKASLAAGETAGKEEKKDEEDDDEEDVNSRSQVMTLMSGFLRIWLLTLRPRVETLII
jgi:hypothetical protein